MDPSKDIEGMLNQFIAALLPALNAALPPFIVSEGLDPMKTVVSGSDDLGSVYLGVCRAKAEAKYSITNMTGVSSLYIETLTAEMNTTRIDGDESTDTVTTVDGTMSMAAKLTSNLKADVSGSIEASCGGISEKVGISGKVTAKGVTGKGDATFTATLSVSKSCLTACHITDLSLNYSDIDITIDDLGIFNDLLQPLVDAINALFGSYIKDELSSVVKGVLNDLLKDMIPYCVQY